MAVEEHSSTNKSGETERWWTLECDVSGCRFTAQGERFASEALAKAALEYHVGMSH